MTTRGEVIPEVQFRLGLVDDDQRVTVAGYDLAFQAAINRISAMSDWWWLRETATVNTVAGTRTVTLASDMQKLKMMWWNNIPILMSQPERLIEYELMQGIPRFFFMSGTNTVSFYPLPDAAYPINYLYYTLETTPVSDATVLKLPDRFRDLYVCMTAIYVARHLNDSEKEGKMKEELAMWMSTAESSNVRSQGSFLPSRRTDWLNYG